METKLRHPQDLFVQPIQYEIPAFQRRYVWKQEEQWEPLWNDVENLAESMLNGGQTKRHFMGAVVLKQEQHPTGTMDRRVVVDGQQRLTTLQLLIDAIREVLKEREYDSPSKRLERLVVNEKEYRDGKSDNAFKVRPAIQDRDAFRQAMRDGLAPASSLIVKAREFFRGQAEQWFDGLPRKEDGSNNVGEALEKAVSKALELVVIDLGDTDDPHVIFETLNARGTPLLQSDMVKNKILHVAGRESGAEQEASSGQSQLWPFENEDWWAKEVGRGFQRRPRIDLYLNHWLTLRNCKKIEAYDEFRAFVKFTEQRKDEGKRIRDIAEDISDIAEDISNIGNIYRDIEEIRRKDIERFLKRRDIMNVRAVIAPLLLWLLSRDVPPPTRERCLKALESFLVRRVICRGYHARSYGNFFVGLIKELNGAHEGKAGEVLISYLAKQENRSTRWPDDAELRKEFVDAPFYNRLYQSRLRMVLTGIEEQLRKEKKVETQEVPDNLHIEHIMPRAWRNKWSIQDPREEVKGNRDHIIDMVGNLTLLNGRLNESLSDSPWKVKRKALDEHAVLFLNKDLVKHKQWDEETIKKRSISLGEIAVRVWPHSDAIGVS